MGTPAARMDEMADERSALGPVARRVVPGLTDVLFVLLFAWAMHPRLFSTDTGWHLWAGAQVLAHGPGLLHDTLSFTRFGAPWRNLEWLGEAALAAAWAHGGPVGLGVLCAATFAGTFTWLYRVLLRDTGHPLAALLVAVLAAGVAYLHAIARPVIFTFPLLLATWELVRAPRAPAWALVGLPLLTVLWANVHPTAFLAPAVGVLGTILARRHRGALVVATALSLLALGATPWGWAWFSEIAPHRAGLLARIDEWMAPRFDEPRFTVVLAYLLVAVTARRGGPPLRRGETLLGLACLAAALRSARLAPPAAILWAPWLAHDMAAWMARGASLPARIATAMADSFAPERRFRPGLWPVLLMAGALALSPWLGGLFPKVARGFPEGDFPVRALDTADRLGLGPRVFGDFAWGGYISLAGHGRYRVFVDGRLGLFENGPLEDYLRITRLQPGWREALERSRADWLLLHADEPVAQAALATGKWREIYRDAVAVILVPSERAGGRPGPGESPAVSAPR